MDFISGFYFICSNFLTHFAMILCRTRSNHSSTLDVIVGNAASPQVTIRLLRKSHHHNRVQSTQQQKPPWGTVGRNGFLSMSPTRLYGCKMETFWFTLTYWCTPSSGTVRFTPECTNVPQPRCTEVPNSSGLRYSVPGTPWFTERYVELRCSEGKKRFSRQFATRHCTALYLTLYLTTEHCTPTSTCVVLHLQVECKAPLNSAEN